MSQYDQHSSSFKTFRQANSYLFDINLIQSSTINSSSIMAFQNVMRRQKAQSSLMSLDFIDNEDLLSSTRLCDDLIGSHKFNTQKYTKPLKQGKSRKTKSLKTKRLSSSQAKDINKLHTTDHVRKPTEKRFFCKDFLYQIVETDNKYDAQSQCEPSTIEAKNDKFSKFGDFVIWYV
jgi:hypothetical protein